MRNDTCDRRRLLFRIIYFFRIIIYKPSLESGESVEYISIVIFLKNNVWFSPNILRLIIVHFFLIKTYFQLNHRNYRYIDLYRY